MPKSKRRKPSTSRGQSNRQKFQARLLEQANATDAGRKELRRSVANQFPWLNTLPDDLRSDALDDLVSATLTAAGGDPDTLTRTVEQWTKIVEQHTSDPATPST